MTQEQALDKAKELLPADASYIGVTRERYIGASGHGYNNEFIVWKHFRGSAEILASSAISWESALSKLSDDYFESDDSPVSEPLTLSPAAVVAAAEEV
jgi:hypothetical protein